MSGISAISSQVQAIARAPEAEGSEGAVETDKDMSLLKTAMDTQASAISALMKSMGIGQNVDAVA